MPSSLAASGTLSPVRLRASVISVCSHSSMRSVSSSLLRRVAQGQVVRANRVVVGQHDGAVEHVAKLPHVAGPVVGEQLRAGRVGEAQIGPAVLAAEVVEEEIDQHGRCRRRDRAAAAGAARTR